MENVVLIIHLILALSLIGIVLMQRSEGGGLGMGSGGGGGVGGVMSGRAAATALGKITWALAAAFICTSIALTVIAASNSSDSSVLDRLGGTAPTATEEQSDAPAGSDLLPPSSSDAPLVPSAN
ncbi:preprotein translocase subunit SecG [Donghicola eburneus]|uniref:Protein-export membrane protein SecG n=1 Tax=Donghicola eburneus TaxID=393278 RepID=A0A1M4N1C8_9RHOB|nr:preprotein translocase subunit SecG [Donghicola eburneus]SCM68589.1 putative membrane protein [Donghicola eburneus]SFQ27809.1 preprotein translocase subunit SecG [Donghicola eburneus]